MRKRLVCVLLCLLLCGCTVGENIPKTTVYSATFLDVFDTVTVIKGAAESKDVFSQTAEQIHLELQRYHRIFDIYQDYEGITNLKTVNDHAGICPIAVDPEIVELLLDCKQYYHLTEGKVNVAMGSVLHLWHSSREAGIHDPSGAKLPDAKALEYAADHTAIDSIVIDEKASTVYLSDPDMLLDVGAVAKGWAAQKVAENAPPGLLISVGGNVLATGPKDQSGTAWVVGVENPDGGDYLHTLYLSSGSVVTSGDYQRRYAVDGKLYHHIIDPDTGYPGNLWRSVTVVCPDSGLADALSTALFLLSLEDGLRILDCVEAEAMWVSADGTYDYSDGFHSLIRT